MEVVFPFIYQQELIHGINGYLAEYFSHFTEASFGDIIAEVTDQQVACDQAGHEVLSVTYNVALPPFDLGVTQELCFTTSYSQEVQAYRLSLRNTRLSGQDSNWIATNQPFLEKLRTYLLHWRNLSPAERLDYERLGREFFSSPDSPAADRL